MTHQLIKTLIGLCFFLGLVDATDIFLWGDDSPPTIVLKGILESKSEWGPPGFGETPRLDSRVSIFVLKLDKPRTARELGLQSDKKDGEIYKEIQLWCDSALFPRCQEALRKSKGRRIAIGGQAAFAVEPTDYSPVTLRVHLVTDR